jgi:hypothetical protein
LTIKFTRSTRNRPQPSAIFAFGKEPSRTRRANSMGLKTSAHRALKAPIRFPHPSRYFFSLGTHKNLQPCRLPNLFSCQISSSSACANCPPGRVWMESNPVLRLSPTQCSTSTSLFFHQVDVQHWIETDFRFRSTVTRATAPA